MRNIQKVLAIAVLGAGLTNCATYSGQDYALSGNPKFTTGASAPSVVGVDAAAHVQASSENSSFAMGGAPSVVGVDAAAHERIHQRPAWAGNPKFTTGISAASPVGVPQ